MSSSSIKTVTLVGASGALGALILPALAEAGFEVTILSRKESSSAFPSNFVVKRADYSNEQELVDALAGQDAVVLALGSLALGPTGIFIDAAARAGVKRFIPSHFGSDLSNPKTLDLVPFLGDKMEFVKLLQAKESVGMTWTTVTNGAFFDWGLKTGFLGIDLNEHTAKVLDPERPGAATMTTLAQVGRGVAAILSHPEETKNRDVRIFSFVVTIPQIIEALERASGQKFSVTTISSYDLAVEAQKKLAGGDGAAALDLIRVALLRDGVGSDFALERNDNALLGLKEEDLDEEVKKLLHQ